MSQVEYFSAKQLAEELNVAEITLAQWRARGQGPSFFKLGRTIRYARVDVGAWLAANRVGKVGAP